MLKTTPIRPNLDDIDAKITSARDLKNSAEVIAESKKQIFDILKTEIAEGVDDESLLKTLKEKLNIKKDVFEKELGKGEGLSNTEKIDFSENTKLVEFWTEYVDGNKSNHSNKATSSQRKDLQQSVKETLKELQRLDVSNASWTLFGGKSFDISNITKNTKLPDVAEILEAKDSKTLEKKIGKFIDAVSKTKNSFHIQHSKLYRPSDDNQRKTALRVALYLYCIHKATENKDLNESALVDMKNILEKQIKEVEIPKFKGIYNVKKELEYVDPEYEMLHDINQKAGDISVADLQYGTSVETTVDLTQNFEHGKAIDIERYTIDSSVLQPTGIQLSNSFWIANQIHIDLGVQQEFDLLYSVGGRQIKLGKIAIDNTKGNAKLMLKLEDLSALQAVLSPTELASLLPITLDIPLKAEKNVKNAPKGKVALTKHIKVQLIQQGVVPPPPPPPFIIDSETEIDAALSEVTSSRMEQISYEVEKKLREEFNTKAHFFKRAARWFSRGRKRKKLINEEKAKFEKKIFSTDANANNEMMSAADRHALLGEQAGAEKDTSFVLDTTTQDAINILSSEYLQGQKNDSQFQPEFNAIIANDSHADEIMKEGTAVSTNLLRKLQEIKEEKGLNSYIKQELWSYLTDNDPAHIRGIQTRLQTFILNFKKDPDFKRDLDALGLTPTDVEVHRFLNHQFAVEKMNLTNLKIKLDLLRGGKWAYEIDNNDRQWWRYKVGNWLDGSNSSKWVNILKHWIIIGGTIVWTAFLWPARWTVLAAWVVGGKNYFKKHTHYTKEQNTHEKDMVKDYEETMKKMAYWRAIMNNKDLSRWKKRKAKSQYKKYERATQSDFEDTKTLSDGLITLLSTSTLSPEEKNLLNYSLYEAYARLTVYRETKHNFLKANNGSQVEQEMLNLEKSLQLWLQREWIPQDHPDRLAFVPVKNPSNMHETVSLDDMMNSLRNNYKEATKKFRKHREAISWKTAWATAAVTATTSLLSQALMWSGVFAKDATEGTEATADVVKNFSDAKSEFLLWKHNLLDNNNEIFNVTKDALWRLPDGAQELTLRIGAGTDATLVKPWALWFEKYLDKLTEVKKVIDSSTLTSGDKTQILDLIKDGSPVDAPWFTQTWFTNGNLHGMRSLEAIEQAIKAYNASGSTLPFNVVYDANLDVAGTVAKNAWDRFTNAVLDVSTEIPWTPGVPGSSDFMKNFFIPIPWFSNTFKRKLTDEDKQRATEGGNVVDPVWPTRYQTLWQQYQNPTISPNTQQYTNVEQMTDQQIFTFIASTTAQSVSPNGTLQNTVSTMRNESYNSLKIGDRVFIYGSWNEGKAFVKEKRPNGEIIFKYDSGKEEPLNSFVNVFQFSTLNDELQRRGAWTP